MSNTPAFFRTSIWTRRGSLALKVLSFRLCRRMCGEACLAGSELKEMGLGPGYGLWPMKKGEARTKGTARRSLVADGGGAKPRLTSGRQSRFKRDFWGEARLGATLLLIIIASSISTAQTRTTRSLSKQDDAFLEDLSRRSFRFFWEQADPKTGLVSDRARANGEPFGEDHRSRNIGSSAATGFGLTALCIAADRGWIDRKAARERALTTLRFYAERSPHERGWFYHFVDKETGERRWRSEISTIDTALLLGGVLTVRQCFRQDPNIVRLATLIYERVDFPWMLAGDSLLISMGWRPETGFIKSTWNHYSEHTILQLLAIGSPTYPINPGAWQAWSRLRLTYAGYTYLTFMRAPLFIHQYSQAWVDYRDQEESWYPYTNYHENSVKATLAHREFCVSLSDQFPGYSKDVWGITASDSAKGYRAWGGPPPTRDFDGTVVPCAAGGSLMFTPEITLAALKTMYERWGDRIYSHYGFVDAFNPNTGWVNPDVIGIDLGITILSAENLRTGNVWRWFMRNREIPRAMRLVGFRKARRGLRNNKQVQSRLLLGAGEDSTVVSEEIRWRAPIIEPQLQRLFRAGLPN